MLWYIKHKEKSMKNNQKGFSVVEILIVVVIVGLVGTVGWLVYDRQKNKNNDQQATTNSSEQKKEVSKEEPQAETLPAGYVNYENKELGIKFNHPKSWGEVSVSQRARNREDFEPIKTHFISFSERTKFVIKISPNNWKFTGGQSSWDFPETEDSFQQARNNKYALQILTNDTSYLQMEWTGIDGAVTLQGTKKLELTKIPAKYVEFQWASVSDNCATESADGTKKPQASCYGQDLVSETQKVLDSFKSN